MSQRQCPCLLGIFLYEAHAHRPMQVLNEAQDVLQAASTAAAQVSKRAFNNLGGAPLEGFYRRVRFHACLIRSWQLILVPQGLASWGVGGLRSRMKAMCLLLKRTSCCGAASTLLPLLHKKRTCGAAATGLRDGCCPGRAHSTPLSRCTALTDGRATGGGS